MTALAPRLDRPTTYAALGDTLCSARASDASLDELPAVDVADLLLFALASRRATAFVVEPAGAQRALSIEQVGATAAVVPLDAELADAIAARLALLASLDVAARGHRVGRLAVRTAEGEGAPTGATTDLIVVLRTTADGLAVEVRRLVGRDEPAGDEAAGVPSEVAAGARIGPYRVDCEIGRGGMGIVYRGEHVLLQKPVAIKVLPPALAREPEVAARVVTEARAACRVRHPGVVDVTDGGVTRAGVPFIVMELVDAPTLERVLEAGPLPVGRALVLARAVADALAAVAARGVVHRDLKPANIFVLSDDRVKIGDFGVARLTASAASGRGAFEPDDEGAVGTVWYMAPEQGRGGPGDTRSDIYSLGVVLFEMLTGEVPFGRSATGASGLAALLQIVEEHATRPLPPLVGPDGAPIPDVAARVVTRALAKRADERYQTAEEMRADLEHAGRTLAREGWRRWPPT